ncbi:hypothetical protein [Caldisericum sp.]
MEMYRDKNGKLIVIGSDGRRIVEKNGKKYMLLPDGKMVELCN